MAAAAYFNKFSSYCRMVAHAKSLANRTILVDHCGAEHIVDLTSELKNVEKVYSIEKEGRRGFTKMSLIEFKSCEDAEQVVRQAEYTDGLLPVPLKILRYNTRHLTSKPTTTTTTTGTTTLTNAATSNLPYPVENHVLSLSKETSTSFNTYTELLSNHTISLPALKMRFVTLVNFERILCSGMFEQYELMPFGSSVIGSGGDFSDLDLIFIRKTDHYNAIVDHYANNQEKSSRQHHQQLEPMKELPKLRHIGKSMYTESKDSLGFRGAMRWFDHVLREYMPLTDGPGVLTLHRAKVPIIKFTSRITEVDCDLSFSLGLDHRVNDQANDPVSWVHHGVLMNEILYYLYRNNNLIAPFVIYLKIYAKLTGITSKVPGIGMTNFQFLSTVIFFLQHVCMESKFQDSLTSSTITSHDEDQDDVNEQSSSTDDHLDHSARMTREKTFYVKFIQAKDQYDAIVPAFKYLIDGSFLTEPVTPKHYSDDDINRIVPQLIRKFFKFYSNYEFNKHAMNLFEARRDRKLDNSAVFVQNPMDKARNICHNVNRKGLETFVIHMDEDVQRGGYCPLALLRKLMTKSQRQAAKNRSLKLDNIEETFTMDGFAQDACR